MAQINERDVQHICVCKIALAGDTQQVVVRGEHNPVSWSEIPVLQDLHGDEAIEDVRPIGLMEYRGAFHEKQRLASIYGFEAVDKVYSGRNPTIERFVPGWPVEVIKQKEKPHRPRKVVLMPEDTAEERI